MPIIFFDSYKFSNINFLKLAFIIEGIIIPENKGPMMFFYWGISGGKKIKKWKIRLIKTKFIDPDGACKK